MKILKWPSGALKVVCEPVDIASDKEYLDQLLEMSQLADSMGGVGLAANQVGLTKRMLIARTQDSWRNFVNPVLIVPNDSYVSNMTEGCLSLPGVQMTVRRPLSVIVTHDTPEGPRTDRVAGLLAQILQHEVEHLDGKTLADRLTPSARDQLRAKIRRGAW